MRDDTLPGLEKIGRVSFLFAKARGDFWTHNFNVANETKRQANLKSFNESKTKMYTEMNAYEAAISNDEDRQAYTKLKQLVDAWMNKVDEAVAAIQDKKDDQFAAAAASAADIFREQLYPHIDEMTIKNATWAKDACNSNIALTQQIEHNALVGLISVIAMSLVAAALLTWSIVPRLAASRRSMLAMSKGSLDDGLEQAKRDKLAAAGDELGDIARAVADLRTYMTDMSGAAKQIAGGDLRTVVTPRGADDLLGTAFKTMRDNLRTSIDTISQSAQTLAGASEELAASSTQLEGSANEASAKAQNAAAATEQVNRGIQTVATASEELATSIKEISSQTQNMSTKVTQTAETATAMVTATRNVDEIATTIAGIAEQTNLLALNATIEAARAGEAGRGFAVVAGEVKALAGQTAEATRNITRILSELRSQAERVGEGTIQVRDATASVASAVEEQNATTTEIGRSMSEAATGSQEIASSVTAAATAVIETKEGVAQVRSATNSLSRIATELQQTVANFKV